MRRNPDAKPPVDDKRTAKPEARPKAKPPKDDDDFDDDDDDFDDDFDDDDDDSRTSMTSASTTGAVSTTAAPQPRKLPWIPISAVAGALVLLIAYAFRDSLFGKPADPPPGDEAGEIANSETPPQPEPSENPPEPEPSEKPVTEPPPAIPPEELEAKLAEADNLVNRQKHTDASKILDEVLAKMPKEPRALALRAIILLEKRKHQDALATANDCVAVDATQAQCWIAIAVVEHENKNLERALEGYRKYLELQPKGAYAKDAKGQVERLERLTAKVEG